MKRRTLSQNISAAPYPGICSTLMNKRAAELGCEDSHFANANGIHEDDHYTSAYDLSLIGAAFFQNDALARIGNTPQYHFTPS
jgi:D-alanyl-D-alanine carboxypeptidase/D-alanyl-D-alanine carboxypeptidase (penicillin-binding protein 5/6)